MSGAGEADGAVYRRILADDRDELGELLPHQLEGDALVGLDIADQAAGILLREKSLGDNDEQEDVETKRQHQHQHDRTRTAQRPRQRSFIAAEHPVEEPFARPVERAAPFVPRPLQQQGAHHRGGGERDRKRDQDCDRQRDGKFTEQAADDAAHEQDRDENGDERDAHRQHCESDLAGAQDRGLDARHAGFQMPRDVLEHDDGIVDHEAGGDGQGHERKVVEAVAQEPHHGEGADERDRDGNGRDQGGPRVAQEQEHDQDHQRDRDEQRRLHVAQRGADGDRPVDCDGDVDGRRDRGFKIRQQSLHPVDRVDDVGAGLAK